MYLARELSESDFCPLLRFDALQLKPSSSAGLEDRSSSLSLIIQARKYRWIVGCVCLSPTARPDHKRADRPFLIFALLLISSTMPDYPDLKINAKELLDRVADSMDPGDLGRLTAAIADIAGVSKKKSFKFAMAMGLWESFAQPEFNAGFGQERIDSVELLKFAFRIHQTPGSVCTAIQRLCEAGSFGDDDKINSDAFMAELHDGIQRWASLNYAITVDAVAKLLYGFVSEVDTYSQLGDFLSAFLRHDKIKHLPAALVDGVLIALCASDDVKDLCGEPEDFVEAVPSRYEPLITEHLLLRRGRGGGGDGDSSDGDDSSVDEKTGHLKGFVVDDDDDEDEEDEEGSDSVSLSSSSPSSSSSSSSSASSVSSSSSEDSSSRKKGARKSKGTPKKKLVKRADRKKEDDDEEGKGNKKQTQAKVGSKRKRASSDDDHDDSSSSSNTSSDDGEESDNSRERARQAAKRPKKAVGDDDDDEGEEGERRESSKGARSSSSSSSAAAVGSSSSSSSRRFAPPPPGMKAGKQSTVAERRKEEKKTEDKKNKKKRDGGKKEGSARVDVSRFFETSAARDR